MQLTSFQTIFLLLPSVLSATFYVSPTGSDSAAGTLAAPYKSIQVAVDKAVAGDSILLRGGTYSPTTNIQVKKSGTASARITLAAYQTEVPIVDGEALTGTPAPVGGSLAAADRGILHVEKASYWTIKGIQFINGPYGVYAVDSSNNIFQQLTTRQNYETGFQLQGSSANNQILYLDSYENRDPRKNGESADGIGIKEGTGEGNLIKGARLWNNVDDGLDFWEFKSKITVVDTIAWGNGVNRWGFTDFQGDGNGFKLGGGDEADKGPADHQVSNSIAFNNVAKGFTDNSQPGNFILQRNTAWNNGDVGFKSTTAVTTFTNNIAASNIKSTTNSAQVSLNSAQKQTGNSWQGSTTWNNTTFKSVDITLVQGKRDPTTGKIAASDFLLPASGAAIGATSVWS
ncbi:polysaccharide lyase family 9 protein [Didymella exigua CBS 183.55]|uniref:Polysaccharide lyase family 9 protein n=1 Tax=Didymella exigua CBS 183.55 TaxID=1150837 RepID=A0A6A5RAJ7_9PLEO|nr:polysaccharide lyase family 9 protein [Didymella exigua CBS 183.55]KAF1924573.1 polysaccharide lyase family 9 protein [Didymella exigua CBS 183.55]